MTCTLYDSLTWVAFGTFNVPFAERNKNPEKLDEAKQLLQRAFITGRVHMASDTGILRPTEHFAFGWDTNSIVPFTYNGQYISERMIIKNVRVIIEDLEQEFPQHVHEQKQSVKQKSAKRPGASILHDVAYYLWEKEKNLSAKEICNIVNLTMGGYPKYKDRTLIQQSSAEKWLTGFRNGTYMPANPKQLLINQFPGLFDKMRKTHR